MIKGFRYALNKFWSEAFSGDLLILSLSIVLAVTSISSVSFLGDRLQTSMKLQASSILGADLVLRSASVIDPKYLELGKANNLEIAETITFLSMVITEDDNLLSTVNTYIFRGNTDNPAVTGSSGDVTRTLQQKLDDRVSVKDYGAVGDGVTDDAAAINRAIKNVFTVDSTNAKKERRSLYFPGGTYKVGSVISIYPHATIVGDGPTSTILESVSYTHLTLPTNREV